ncbi:hypothetical protein IQ251_16920 [Saccharopolyspora sp. HNM0983]|uniref:Uncharacterized protein n=1 Tax=Saccharopolyspora montiporae TaxID=2781240 RepID=A0A929BD21_9PSEU|nr:hypothetical protein [Saccharopolyspora sp. HNM0983]MBE9376135.1 hypothetical protein [Saccharopolyspora sp. HNM0983]
MTISEPTAAPDLDRGGSDREPGQFPPSVPQPGAETPPTDLGDHDESHLIRGYD